MADRSTAELSAEREFLLRSLEDLEQERHAGEITSADYEVLRDSYSRRAAAVLRALDRSTAPRPPVSTQPAAAGPSTEPAATGPSTEPAAAGPPTRSAARPPRAKRIRRRYLLVAGIAAIAAGGTLAALAAATGSRPPGQPITGSVSVSQAQALQRDMVQGRTLAAQGHYTAAEQLFAEVLRADPRQPEALAYQGWVLRQAGLAGGGEAMLAEARASEQAAIAADPDYPDAHAFLGYILLEDDHDVAGAVGQFRAFLADHPPTAMVQLTRPVVGAAFAAAGEPVPEPAPPAGS